VQFLDASFAEHLDRDEQPIFRPVAIATRAMAPIFCLSITSRRAVLLTVFTIPTRASATPWSDWPRRCVGSLSRLEDALHQSLTGNHAMATIGTFVQLFRRLFYCFLPFADATVFAPSKAAVARISADDFIVDWEKREIFVVRAGKKSGIRRPRTVCCSPSPIAPFKKRYTSSERIAGMSNTSSNANL